MSFCKLMDDLSSAWRKTDAPAEPATDDGGWYIRFRLSLRNLKPLTCQSLCPSQNQRIRQNKSRIVSEVAPERMQLPLPVLYSPADWESIFNSWIISFVQQSYSKYDCRSYGFMICCSWYIPTGFVMVSWQYHYSKNGWCIPLYLELFMLVFQTIPGRFRLQSMYYFAI